MTILTHTHRVTEAPDYCDCASMVGTVDTTHTEQPWRLITLVQAVIAVVACAVLVWGGDIYAWVVA